jgi:hypothetical protein
MKTKTNEEESVPGTVVTGDVPADTETTPVATAPGTDTDTITQLQAEVEQLKETVRLSTEAQRDPVASIDAGAGGRSGPQLTKETLAKMKPSEIAELDWADVKRTLSGT